MKPSFYAPALLGAATAAPAFATTFTWQNLAPDFTTIDNGSPSGPPACGTADLAQIAFAALLGGLICPRRRAA